MELCSCMASASQVPGGPDLNLLSFYLRTEQAKQSYEVRRGTICQ